MGAEAVYSRALWSTEAMVKGGEKSVGNRELLGDSRLNMLISMFAEKIWKSFDSQENS